MRLRERGWQLTCTDVDPGTLGVYQTRISDALWVVVEPTDMPVLGQRCKFPAAR